MSIDTKEMGNVLELARALVSALEKMLPEAPGVVVQEELIPVKEPRVSLVTFANRIGLNPQTIRKYAKLASTYSKEPRNIEIIGKGCRGTIGISDVIWLAHVDIIKNTEKRYLTTRQVAEMVGISEFAVADDVSKAKIKPIKMCQMWKEDCKDTGKKYGKLIFLESVVAEYIQKRKTGKW